MKCWLVMNEHRVGRRQKNAQISKHTMVTKCKENLHSTAVDMRIYSLSVSFRFDCIGF